MNKPIVTIVWIAFSILLLPAAVNGAEVVGVAANISRSEAAFDVPGSAAFEVEYRRFGIEYWEGVLGYLHAGVELGYSETERLGSTSGMATGHYVGLGIRYLPRFNNYLALRAEAGWRIHDEEVPIDTGEHEIRIYESRGLLAPELNFGPLTLSAGGAWRRMDYRERKENGGLLSIRVSEDAQVVPFAALSLRADTGVIRFEYTADEQSGWRAQFVQEF